MKKWFRPLLEIIEKIPIERLFVKPPDNKKRLQELQGILATSHATPAEPPADNPPEELPAEYEELRGFLVPRDEKVHVEPPPSDGVSLEDTVAYQNREIGKLLLRMERHCVQGFRINGVPCDCGQSKHLLDLESLSEETIPMVDNPDNYYQIINVGRELGPKCGTVEALTRYESEFPGYSQRYRDLRKEVIGTLDAKALFPQRPGEPEEAPETELPATELTDEGFEEQRKDLLARGIIT